MRMAVCAMSHSQVVRTQLSLTRHGHREQAAALVRLARVRFLLSLDFAVYIIQHVHVPHSAGCGLRLHNMQLDLHHTVVQLVAVTCVLL